MFPAFSCQNRQQLTNGENDVYQDWRQWARLIYAVFLLALVWNLIQPDMIQQALHWESQRGMGKNAAMFNTIVLVIAAGLMIPKAKRLEPLDTDKPLNDSMQFALGLVASIIGFTIAML